MLLCLTHERKIRLNLICSREIRFVVFQPRTVTLCQQWTAYALENLMVLIVVLMQIVLVHTWRRVMIEYSRNLKQLWRRKKK